MRGSGLTRIREILRETRTDQAFTPRALSNLPQLLKVLFEIDRLQASLLVVVQFLRGLLPASAALIAKGIVDSVTRQLGAGSTDFEPISRWLLLGAGVAAALVILEVVSTLIEQLLQERLIPDLNLRLVRKAVELEFEFFENPEYYDMLTQAEREISNRPIVLVRQTTTLLSTSVTIVGFVVILMTFSPWLTLLLLGTFIPTVIMQRMFGRSLFLLWRRHTPLMRLGNYYKHLLTGVAAAMEIRIFQLGEEFIKRLQKILTEIRQKNTSLTISRSLIVGTLELLSVGVYWGAFAWIVASTLRDNRFTVGDLVLFSTIFLQMRSQMVNMLSAVQGLYEGGLFIDNFFSFLQLPSRTREVPSGERAFPRPIKRGITFESVTFQYPGSEVPALSDVELHFKPGARIAIVGENGAGKSTLAKLIARLYRPTSGRILLDGVPLDEYQIDDYYRNLSALNQGFVKYHLTVEDNIGFGDIGALGNRARIERAAKLSNADEIVDDLPQGYSTLLGRSFEGSVELSAGQWQRLALARAYMAESQILILDEPTASLDVGTEAKMVEQYAQLAIGQIAVMITHRFSTVRMADRIIVLSAGRVVEDGTHEELLAHGGIYAAMFNTQAEPYIT
jgi:ATP-binding cassette subfamily B protein